MFYEYVNGFWFIYVQKKEKLLQGTNICTFFMGPLHPLHANDLLYCTVCIYVINEAKMCILYTHTQASITVCVQHLQAVYK